MKQRARNSQASFLQIGRVRRNFTWNLVQGLHFTERESEAQRVQRTLLFSCSIKCNNECEHALKNTVLYTNVKYFDVLISLFSKCLCLCTSVYSCSKETLTSKSSVILLFSHVLPFTFNGVQLTTIKYQEGLELKTYNTDWQYLLGPVVGK